jgi:Tfp pilus assembly protein PilF
MGLPGVEAYVFRGIALAILKKPALSEKDYDKAIQLDPHNALAYKARGFLFGISVKDDLSNKDFDKACE